MLYIGGLRLEQVKGILDMQGAQERYRWSNEGDQEARDAAIGRIRKTLLYRSYLRLKYRMPIGTIMVEYNKMPANFEYLKFKPTDFIKNLMSVPVRTQKQVERTTESFRNFVRLAQVRQGQADTFLVGSALWAWDAIRGYKTMSQVGMAVFQMLYLDAKEDLSLMTGEGVQDFATTFSKRYTSNDQDRNEAKLEVCTIDDSQCGGRNANLGFVQKETVIGKVKKAITEIRVVLPNMQQARDLQKTMDELDRVESSAVFKQTDDNAGDIFGK